MTEPNTLVIGYNGRFKDFTMSPLRIRPRGGVPRWMYSSLLRYDEQLELEGDLAEHWDVSADGRRYQFLLRPGLEWHDGHPLTASDVVYTASLLQQPHRYFRNTLMVGGRPVQFHATDDRTVDVVLAEPQTNFPAYVTPIWGSLFLVLPEHRLRNITEQAFEDAPIGSGPFKFGGLDENGHLVLEAFPRYHAGQPRLSRVELQFFPSNDARVASFRNGELDVMLFPGRTYSSADARAAGGRLYRTTTNTIVQFAMNCRHPVLSSVRVRQAIAAAVDRPTLLREIEGPEGVAAYGPVGPGSWASVDDLNRHPHNPARAEALLESEGWTLGRDGLRRKGGSPLRFSVIFPPDEWNYALSDWANGIGAYLKRVGIELEVRPVPYWSGMKPAWRSHEFDAFIYYDTFYVEPDLYWSWHSAMPKRPAGPDAPAGLPQYGYGVTGYRNDEVDRLIEAYRQTADRATQQALVTRAERIMADEVASLWLYNHQWKNVVRDNIVGLSEPTLADGTSDLIVLLRPERLGKLDHQPALGSD